MSFTLPEPVLFGAAYYPEYLTSDRLGEDMRLMAAAGFSAIRVGESTWSTWEPEDGRFDVEWLAPALDAALANGIHVILGTPTYAVPPWLARKHPEIGAERHTGERIGWGARQEMDFTHPAFRYHAERVIRHVVGRYCGHPAVIGYQMDNEPGLEILHNRGVFQGFVDDLRHRYKDVETLNRAWGLVYWSHRLSTWADLWTPDNNTVPQYDLAWRRYQAQLTAQFVGWQARIVRQYARPDQFVTTCLAYDRPAVEPTAIADHLEVSAANLYFGMQDALALPGGETVHQGWATTGIANVFLNADLAYASRQEPFLVTETDASSVGGPAMNYPGYDGQWRQLAWALIARGARLIEYWHWHSLPWGYETYWGGILPHDQQPGRVYAQIAALGRELHAVGPLLEDLVPDARLGLLWSKPSAWALDFQPPFPAQSGDLDHNPTAYQQIIGAFYQAALATGVPVRILHDTQLVDEQADRLDPGDVARDLPALLIAGLYVASDELLNWLHRYVLAGGHLILGPRSAYADAEARARQQAKPALLDDLAGLTYQELANLTAPVTVQSAQLGATLPADAQATLLVDGLLPQNPGDTLATYLHPHYRRFAAIASHASGAGRVTTVGTIPNLALGQALMRWIAAGSPDPWGDLVRGSLTHTCATTAGGRRLHVIHNWSWEPTTITLPQPAAHLAAPDVTLPAGTAIELGPWDVRVLRQ